jgi:hypothetical protein
MIPVDPSTKFAFCQHISKHPSTHRFSQADREDIIRWLSDNGKPSSQREFSRRNYVKKTFYWDEKEHELFAIGRKVVGKGRKVVTEDMIVDTIVMAHQENGHRGWDTTWKDVSESFYGMLRADVSFVLKRCPECAREPRKHPKSRPCNLCDGRTDNSEQRHSLLDCPSSQEVTLEDDWFEVNDGYE